MTPYTPDKWLTWSLFSPLVPPSISFSPCGQGVVLTRCMPPSTNILWPIPPPNLWSLSDSGWLWERSGLGISVLGSSACCTDIVRRKCVRLGKKSGFAERPKVLLCSNMRMDEVFWDRTWWPNCSDERCMA